MITEQDIFEIIREAETAADLSKLTAQVSLREIGADSLDMSNILLGLEERTGLAIPDEDVVRLHSVRAMLDYIAERS